jgi:uncharacterized membrane protein HdeD (DUF308 family)
MDDRGRCLLDRKKTMYIGLILVVGGILFSIDGIGSILAEFNTHDFWSDLERLIRTVGGFLLVLLGIYMYRNAD